MIALPDVGSIGRDYSFSKRSHPSHAPSFTALPVRAKIRLASQIGGETLKDFSDFLKEYSENQEFKDRMADAAAGNLSVEQFSAVSKMLLILLRKYHEWSQT